MKTKVTTEIYEKWYRNAKQITLTTLPEFLRHLTEDYEHDYNSICHAIAAGGIATIWAMNATEQGGITGFQAGAIMWEFIFHWFYKNNKTVLNIVNYDYLLYPQYEDRFEKTISIDIWQALQKEAKNKLEEKDDINEEVLKHWQSIVRGEVPFGFRVEDN